MTTSDEPLGAVMPIQTEASDEVLAEQAVRIQMTLEDQTDAGGAETES
jgi:hypothetical protein